MLSRHFCILIILVPLAGCQGKVTLNLGEKEIKEGCDVYFPVVINDYVEQELPVRVVLSDPQPILQEGSDRLSLAMKILVEVTSAAPTVPELPKDLPTESGPFPGKGPPPSPLSPPTQNPTSTGETTTDERHTPPPEQFDGVLTISSQINYRSDEGSFYLPDSTIDEFSFDELPSQLDQPVREAATTALRKYLAENSIYTLSDEDTKTKAAKMVLKSVTVQNGALKVELGL